MPGALALPLGLSNGTPLYTTRLGYRDTDTQYSYMFDVIDRDRGDFLLTRRNAGGGVIWHVAGDGQIIRAVKFVPPADTVVAPIESVSAEFAGARRIFLDQATINGKILKN